MNKYFALFLALAVAAPAASPIVSSTNFLPASDARFLFEGRFDLDDPAKPVIVWQGSRVRLDFSGDMLALRFTDVKGQNFFDVNIDGHTTLAALREGAPPEGTELSGLGGGRHHLLLFKRSEAAAGTVRFTGVEFAPNAGPWTQLPPHYKLAMLFLGDSIT